MKDLRQSDACYLPINLSWKKSIRFVDTGIIDKSHMATQPKSGDHRTSVRQQQLPQGKFGGMSIYYL